MFDAKWDRRFLTLAEHIASWSKDPSTQVGAVIVRPDKTVCSIGFNGFPRGMEDNMVFYVNRENKYSRIIHAEMNAILHAREDLDGYCLYTWPLFPCDRCAVHVAQSGIKRVVAPAIPGEAWKRWGPIIQVSMHYFQEMGVEWTLINDNVVPIIRRENEGTPKEEQHPIGCC